MNKKNKYIFIVGLFAVLGTAIPWISQVSAKRDNGYSKIVAFAKTIEQRGPIGGWENDSRDVAEAAPECVVEIKPRLNESMLWLENPSSEGSYQLSFSKKLSDSSEIKDLTELISLVPVGQAVMEKFTQALFNQEIVLAPLTKAVRTKYKLSNSILGYFVYQREKKIIYLSTGVDVGRMAPTLFHEIIHSQDESYLRACETNFISLKSFIERRNKFLDSASRREGIPREQVTTKELSAQEVSVLFKFAKSLQRNTDECRLRAEQKAFNAQFEWMRAMSKQLPCASNYYEWMKKNQYIIYEKLSKEQVIKMYRLGL